MVKRGGLVRMAGRAHGPGDAGGYERKSVKIKKKIKVKVKPSSTAAAAATSVIALAGDDDMFAMGIPSKISVRARKKKNREQKAQQQPVALLPAFEDEKKQSMLDQILAAAKGNQASASTSIGIDAHRARTEELRRAKAERHAMKAEKWAAAHKKRV